MKDDGIFARKDMEEDDLIAYYSVLSIDYSEYIDEDEYKVNLYWIKFCQWI